LNTFEIRKNHGWEEANAKPMESFHIASACEAFCSFPVKRPGNLDHSQGKWFAPGEMLPAGYIVTAHPEGHTAPQEGHSMSDKARR